MVAPSYKKNEYWLSHLAYGKLFVYSGNDSRKQKEIPMRTPSMIKPHHY